MKRIRNGPVRGISLKLQEEVSRFYLYHKIILILYYYDLNFLLSLYASI